MKTPMPSPTGGHTPGPWKWVDRGGWFNLQNEAGQQVLDDGSACGEYNREIEPDSDDGRLIADAPAALLILRMLCAGVARIEPLTPDLTEILFQDQLYAHRSGSPWTDTINAIGWDRCRAALGEG